MSDWKEMKRAHYKSNMVVLSSYGTINFNPDSVKEVVGAERITYDEYLDIQMQSGMSVRHSFEQCYYEIALEFKGEIEKKNNSKVCFKRIYVDGMYSDGQMFEGKEDHVWMDIKGFENYEIGDSVQFGAEIYRYLKTGNGKAIDYGLRNPEGIRKIESYKLPTDAELKRQAIEQLVCETCLFTEKCYGMCLLPKGEKKSRVEDLLNHLN